MYSATERDYLSIISASLDLRALYNTLKYLIKCAFRFTYVDGSVPYLCSRLCQFNATPRNNAAATAAHSDAWVVSGSSLFA